MRRSRPEPSPGSRDGQALAPYVAARTPEIANAEAGTRPAAVVQRDRRSEGFGQFGQEEAPFVPGAC